MSTETIDPQAIKKHLSLEEKTALRLKERAEEAELKKQKQAEAKLAKAQKERKKPKPRKKVTAVKKLLQRLEKRDLTETGNARPRKGPKSSYDPKYCETVVQCAKEGGDMAAMALACGLKSRRSMHTWRQQFPEFDDAIEHAMLIRLERYEAIKEDYILGNLRNGHYKALEMTLRHLDPEKYGSNDTSITHATQINIQGDINNMDMATLEKRIQQAVSQLPADWRLIEHDDSEAV